MKSWKYMLVMLILTISATACKGTKRSTTVGINEFGDDKSPILSEKQYRNDGIEAAYPWFEQEQNGTNPDPWNQIIQEDFNKILQIYSFNPFPELRPTPGAVIPTILNITYDVKINDDRFFSVLYKAAYNSPYSAHPTELVYTTNIDKVNGTRLKLSDLVRLDKDFVKDFRTWSFITFEEGNEELNQAIKDYLAGLSDEDLLTGFKEADQIGYENVWGVYSYITPKRLGISLGVPNYIGDHVEFEREYTAIEKYLQKEPKAQ